MKAKRLQVGILIGGLLCAGVAAADPLTTLLGLLVVDKVSTSQPGDARPYPWRTMLSNRQLATLESLRHNPAVGACIAKADNGNPIAAYQVRKIATFTEAVKIEITRTHRLPDVTAMRYQRPAKAYAWCTRQAGISSSDSGTRSLIDYADSMVALVRSGGRQPAMLAANSPY